jgi:hypothetical protein
MQVSPCHYIFIVWPLSKEQRKNTDVFYQTLNIYPIFSFLFLRGALPPSPPSPINTNTIAVGHVWYIKLPMYLFFYMELGLNDFDGGKFITRAIGRGGP